MILQVIMLRIKIHNQLNYIKNIRINLMKYSMYDKKKPYYTATVNGKNKLTIYFSIIFYK